MQIIKNIAVKSKYFLLQNTFSEIDSVINNLTHSEYITVMKNQKMLKIKLKILYTEV